MTPVMQTVTGPRGNCMSACFASVFDLPISDVPNFYEITSDDAGWWLAVRKWLAARGFGILDITFEEEAQWQHLQLSGAHIVSGPSPRGAGMFHATVWQDGRLVHDPHPDQTGIVKPEVISLLYRITHFETAAA